MLVIGIDPGVSGAVAFIGDRYAEVHDAPTHSPGTSGKRRIDPRGVVRLLRRAFTEPLFGGTIPTTIAVIEYASTRPGEAAARAFGYGQGHGIYLGALAALDVPPLIVTPKKWKGAMQLSADKKLSLGLARRLFPGLHGSLAREKDDGRAEALLIAHWARGCFPSAASAASSEHQDNHPDLEF